MAITYTDKTQLDPYDASKWNAQDANEVKSEVNTHLSDVANPHAVTKSQVGLDQVDNTSDLNKPVSTAQQTALNGKVDNTITVNGHALSANVTVTQADVGLSNVDNTSDVSKPISTATQTALDNKEDKEAGTLTAHGFAVGEAVYKDSTGWHRSSNADNTITSRVDGIVVQVVDANNFIVGRKGTKFAFTGTADTNYYLTNVSPNYTTVEPTTVGQVVQLLFQTNATTEATIVLSDPYTIVTATEVSDGDKGDITVTSGVWNIDAGVVGTTELADASVTVAKVSATGTPSATTYLRGDGTWSTPAGGSAENSNFTKMTYYAVPNQGITNIHMKGWGNNAFGQTQGTATARSIANTSIQTQLPRLSYVTAGTATAERASFRTSNTLWTGNAAGLGGYDFVGRVGFPQVTTDRSIFFGLVATSSGWAGTSQPSGQVNIIGIAVDSTDVNWQLIHNDGAGSCTKVDTGIAVSTTDVLEVRISVPANGTTFSVTFRTSSGGSYTNTTINTDLPDNGTFLNFFVQNQTNASTQVISADFYYAYAEAGLGF